MELPIFKLYFIFSFVVNISHLLAPTVYEFVDTHNAVANSDSFNFATSQFIREKDFQESMIICSAFKLDEVNTDNTQTLFVIYDDDSFDVPWFSIGFWNNRVLYAEVLSLDWYKLGTAHLSDLLDWFHICIEMNFESETLRTSIAGNVFTIVHNVTGLAKKGEDFVLRLGIVHHSYSKIKYQFFGQVTNINIFDAKNPETLHFVSRNPCFCNNSTNLESLSVECISLSWNITGDVKTSLIDSDELCFDKTFANLRIPLLWKKNNALKFCSKFGNGEIYMPSHVQNLSSLNTNAIYGQYHTSCKEFWTPISDEEVEGVFVNEYTGELLKYFTRTSFHSITF